MSVYIGDAPTYDTVGFSQFFGRAGCKITSDRNKADFVVFAGGSDVSPHLYGQLELQETLVDHKRDKRDIELYEWCKDNAVPMVGICRGSQLLWVLEGGRLFQDVDNHNDGSHEILVYNDMKRYTASSVHHQMVVPSAAMPSFKLLANSVNSTKRKSAEYISTGPASDFEIWTIQDKAIIGIQGHPEYAGFPNYSRLCLEIIEQYIYDNPMTVMRQGRLRLKKDI